MSTTMDLLLNEPFTGSMSADEARLRSIFTGCSDMVFHAFTTATQAPVLCIYCVGLCDTERLERQVLAPLQQSAANVTVTVGASHETTHGAPSALGHDETMRGIRPSEAPMSSVQTVHTIGQAVQALMDGGALLLMDGKTSGTVYPLYKTPNRTPQEPAAESTVRGARDGFTESLDVNLSLLRKRIKTPSLKLKKMTVGEYTSTQVALVYVEGIIDPSLLEEAESRLKRLNLKEVLESQYIEEAIIDQKHSPFPQMMSTERPDVVASNVLEGRFALIVDGTPFSLIAPVTLFSMLQSPEDYFQDQYMSVFIRWLRYLFYVLSLLLPSAYVAITTFHQEMIPTVLMLSIAKAREEIPFPALVEAFIMEISFEALREAGVRLPKQVGSAVSIVGALIIGQAATSAGIVSAPMIIIVAITGIASFMIPRYAASIVTRLLRFPMMLLAGTLGLTGVMLGLILIVIHLSSLRSFGVPYLSPATPTSVRSLKDVWWRPSPKGSPK